MPLTGTPSSERIRISFFGLRNAGKSSVMNAFAAQDVSLVSEIAGTTTDPVKKTMELLPLGPVLLTDTAGLDDEGALGALRVQKTKEILDATDIAVLVVDAKKGFSAQDEEIKKTLEEKNIPYVIALNKCDLLEGAPAASEKTVMVSALKGRGIKELKEAVAALKPVEKKLHLVSDFIKAGDFVVLVIPIDAAAPKDRLILPEQMALRDILDARAVPVCCQPSELRETLSVLKKKPALVVTDSQAFLQVDSIVPKEIPLTSFSILMARYKGTLKKQLEGAAAIDSLNDGDTVVISEGCTHHRQCGDIGTQKIPALLKKYTKKNPALFWTSGGSFINADFEEKAEKPKLILHCGGCMLSQKEMEGRVSFCEKAGIPVTNYGMAIAKMSGILERAMGIFGFLC